MAFSNLPAGCSVPEIPDIAVPDLCSLPEIPEASPFVPNVVRLPPIPAPPQGCVDMSINIKSVDCFGITLSMPASFGVPPGGNCSDLDYEISVELPCWMLGPVMATLKTSGYEHENGEYSPSSVEDVRTLDGRKLDITGTPAVFCASASEFGGVSVSKKSTVMGFVSEKKFIHVRSC